MPTIEHIRKNFFQGQWGERLFDICWHLLKSAGLMKPKSERLVGTRKSVFANIADSTHGRLQRRAAAAHLSAAKYTGVALDFYMDLEDAFGGPMADQFRSMILRNVGGMAAKLEKALKA